MQNSDLPYPPADRIESHEPFFLPAPDLWAWARDTLIDAEGALFNEDHAHLEAATIGFLWTNVGNSRKGRKGRTVIGQAELGAPQGAMGTWAKARAEQQITEWFGQVPDFIITINAEWWTVAGDAERCALLEHELYHCAQDRDAYGAPKFSKSTGRPVFTIRGHDVEEFVGVVRRYGAGATGVQELVEAAQAGPEIAEADIASACGVCLKAA